jgi:hypothetical protein
MEDVFMRLGTKIVSALLLMAAALTLFTGSAAAGSGENTVSYTFIANAYEIGMNENGHQITMDGYGRIPTFGVPMLPSKIFHVAVPPGAEVTGVTYEAGQRTTLSGVYDIAPVTLHRVVSGEDPDLYAREKARYEANHAAVYDSAQPFPADNAEYVGTAGYRKYNLAEVRVSPFTWNPRSGKLTLTEAVTVHVHYTVPERLPQGTVLVDNLVRCEKIARELVVNYNQAQAWYPQTNAGRGLHDYVIITIPALTSTVQPLVDGETAKGRTVEVVTTDWISTNYAGWDLAAKMRAFLLEKYPSAEWGIEDVCLVGHYDDVPMRRTAQDIGYGAPETDYYYAELSKPDSQSWDANGNHQYGENSDPIDFTAEVNVGRLPWSGVSDVQHMCQKSVAYEASTDLSFKKNILLLGAYFWPDTDNAVLMEYKTNPSMHPWMSEWTSTKLYEVGHTSYPCDGTINWNNTKDTWSSGKYAFVNWAGHGNPTGCYIYYGSGESFSNTSTCNYLNDDYPAIIFADACSNSDTDHTNLGQCMLRKGGVGFVGATKVALGCPGWNHKNSGSSQSMDYYFTSSVTSGDYTQGAALQFALRTMYTNGLWGYNKFETFEWSSIWGQPDLTMHVEPAINMDFPDGVPVGTQNPGLANTVTVEITAGQENYVAGSGKLHYRFDSADPYTEVTVTPLGGDLFEVTIPNTAPGDEPEFYFSAQGDGGTTLCMPYDAPASVYSFDICFVELLMEDHCEAVGGWTVQNTSISTGAFELADPQATSDGGTPVQPGDDHSNPGTKCWVTQAAAGSNYYAYDVDGGPTRLISPVIDLSTGDAYVSFWVWFYHSSSGTVEPCDVHVTNNGTTWVKAMSISHSNSWNQYSFKVSDYVTPNNKVQIRITADDSPNDSVVEAAFDDLVIERLNADPSLWADGYSIPVSTGAVVHYSLDAGAGHAGRQYLLLGSMSGTSPGYPLPGGAVLPLNWDVFTDLVMLFLGSPVCQDFMGYLDGSGTATAALDTQGSLDAALIGVTAHFAFLLGGPFDYTSNAIPVTFDP